MLILSLSLSLSPFFLTYSSFCRVQGPRALSRRFAAVRLMGLRSSTPAGGVVVCLL